MNKLSIIIPAYNEGNTIHLILDKIFKTKLPDGVEKEIVIVDDCSTDNTELAIKKYISVNNATLLYILSTLITKVKAQHYIQLLLRLQVITF